MQKSMVQLATVFEMETSMSKAAETSNIEALILSYLRDLGLTTRKKIDSPIAPIAKISYEHILREIFSLWSVQLQVSRLNDSSIQITIEEDDTVIVTPNDDLTRAIAGAAQHKSRRFCVPLIWTFHARGKPGKEGDAQHFTILNFFPDARVLLYITLPMMQCVTLFDPSSGQITPRNTTHDFVERLIKEGWRFLLHK